MKFVVVSLPAAGDRASGGHTGGASGAVHQGPRPLGAHQRGPDSNFYEKLTLLSYCTATETIHGRGHRGDYLSVSVTSVSVSRIQYQ